MPHVPHKNFIIKEESHLMKIFNITMYHKNKTY